MTLYLKNAVFVDWETIKVSQTDLAVGDGSLEFLSAIPAGDRLKPEDRVMDCAGKLVTKSFGCGHHHIYSTLARGMPAPHKIPENFLEILKYVWWHLDKQLDMEMIEAGALAAALFCAKNGSTFVIDHHASPFAVEGSLSTIAKAFDRVGISALLCYECSDRDGEGPSEAGLAETDRFLSEGGQGHVGLHASFTVGEELLGKAVELAKKHDTGLHIHVAEDLADQEDALAKYGKRVVERLEGAGALELPKSIFSHAIHLSNEEKKLVRESGVWAAQNSESNQNNNVGLTGYNDITSNVILGTDGLHSDMLRSAKAAFLASQAYEGMGYDEAYRRFRNVHRYAKTFGASGDGDDNLVILDYDPPTDVTSDNFPGHFMFGLEARHVETVISKGRVIIDERKPTLVNEREVLDHAKEMGRKLWSKMVETPVR